MIVDPTCCICAAVEENPDAFDVALFNSHAEEGDRRTAGNCAGEKQVRNQMATVESLQDELTLPPQAIRISAHSAFPHSTAIRRACWSFSGWKFNAAVRQCQTQRLTFIGCDSLGDEEPQAS